SHTANAASSPRTVRTNRSVSFFRRASRAGVPSRFALGMDKPSINNQLKSGWLIYIHFSGKMSTFSMGYLIVSNGLESPRKVYSFNMMLFFSRIAQSGDCFHLSAQSGDKRAAALDSETSLRCTKEVSKAVGSAISSARNCGHWSAAKVNSSTIAMPRPCETSAQTVDPKTGSDGNIHNASRDWVGNRARHHDVSDAGH